MSDINDLAGKLKISEWLSGMYNKNISEQKSELQTLFTQIQDTGLSDEQRVALTESKTSLQATVEKLEAELAVLEEKMTESQEEIDKVSDQIATLLSTIKTQTDTIETNQKQHAKDVVSDVFSKRKRDPNYGADQMVADMFKGMKKFEDNSGYKALQSNLSLLSGKESKIKSLVENASALIDNKNSLEKRYGVTKSTYDLISANLSAAVLKDGSFTNADIGATKPIYSATKLETLVPYFDNTSINVESGANSSYKEGTKAPNPTFNGIKTKYKDYFKTPATSGVDANSYDNATVQSLGKAIDAGMLTDLKLAGVSGSKLIDFLTENFAGANIKKSDDGQISIPYGHGAQAASIFKTLTDFVSSQNIGDDTSTWKSDYFKGVPNTWDKNKGNTISTNNQIKALSENFEAIAASMVAKGFTFKEAMYAMFDKDNGLFKNSGVIYDLTKQNDGLKYFMEYAGDDQTADAYKNIAAIIYKNWGVKPTMCIDYDNIDNERQDGTPEEEPAPEQPVRTDPLSFVDGDTEFTFIVDRNSDGKFNDKTEFLGGSGSSSWLDDLKALDADGNGIIENDELKNLKILKSKINDNATTNKDGNATTETTTIGYEFTDAKELGIENINLNDLENNVNQKTGRVDVNNSEVFKDSFKFTLNGKEVTAKRKDDTDEYMKTVYSNTYGTRLDNKFGLNEQEIDGIIEEDFGKFDKFKDKFKDYEGKVNVLKAFGSTVQETEGYVEEAKVQSDKEQKAIINRGQNKAEAMYGNSGEWSSIKDKVVAAGKAQGIDVDSGDFLIQTEGIYINDGTLTPDEIVNKYLELKDDMDSAETRRKNATLAFTALVECARNGISAKLNDILDLLANEKATNVDEIIEYFKTHNADEEAQTNEETQS